MTQHLGLRNPKAVYQHSDCLKSLPFNFCIGGDVLDDLNTLKNQLQDHPSLKICSPDTVEYVFYELSKPSIKHITDKGIEHLSNLHKGYNDLPIALCLQGGILKNKEKYTLYQFYAAISPIGITPHGDMPQQSPKTIKY